MKKLKYFIPSIILMIIIYTFSNQSGSESSGLSSQIVVWIETYLRISIPELIIRKGAHMSEYALLASTFLFAFYKNKFSINKVYLYSLICSFTYACSDELHQLYIGGRAGQFTDVLIDTSGALILIVLVYLINQKIFYKNTIKKDLY